MIDEITRDDSCNTIQQAHQHGSAWEIKRIRAAIEQRCGRDRISLGGNPFRCELNLGHIGDCSAFSGTLTITRERLEEILNG